MFQVPFREPRDPLGGGVARYSRHGPANRRPRHRRGGHGPGSFAGDDFYRFANGGWLDRTTIPADRSFVAVRTEINDRAIAQQLTLLQDAVASGSAAQESDEGKAVALFAQGPDMAVRNRAGIAPIQDALDRIAAIDSKEAYYSYLSRAPSMASALRCASRSLVSAALCLCK